MKTIPTFEKGTLLNKMLVLATTKHSGQFDKGGNPYILHPLKVMYYLKSDDEELNCIGLGHDLFEDTDVTRHMLHEMGFTDRVIAGITALTKVPGETHEEYKARVKSNPDAVKVKMCDLRHNSDIRRLKGVTEKDVKRIAKYHEFYLELKEL
jgi:(p)ppGpp synthase/HD superfamily hydrolase